MRAVIRFFRRNKKKTRAGRRWLRRIAIVSLLFLAVLITYGAIGSGASSVSASSASSSGFVHTMTIPLEGGRFHVGRVLGGVGGWLGLDGNAIERKLDLRLDVSGRIGRIVIDKIQSLTNSVISTQLGPDQLTLTLDRLRLRREEKNLRTRFRLWVGTLFPEAAAAAAARYGVWVHRPGQSDSVAVTDFQPMDHDSVVVLVHGLDDPGRVWMNLRPALLDHGVTVAQFEYPNDQPIDESTRLLAEELRQLRRCGVDRVSIVCHSMGGLVSRHVLTDPRWYGGHGDAHEDYPDVDRLIMVGTPHHGSQLARLRLVAEARDQIVRVCSGEGMLFGAIFDGAGEAKIDLLPGSAFLTALNDRPHPAGVKMMIIAGKASPVDESSIERVRAELKPWLSSSSNADDVLDEVSGALEAVVAGVGDGSVSLASSRLEGVEDYTLVEANHLSMIRNVFESSTRVPPAVPIILDRLDVELDPSPVREHESR